MNHPTEHFTDYLDGTLAPSRRAEIDAHLATCDACRGEIDRARSAKSALAGLPDLEVPLGIDARVAERTKRASSGGASAAPKAGFRKTYRVIAGLAAAALIGVFAITMLRSGGPASMTASDSLEAESGAGAPNALIPASPNPKDNNITGLELQELAEREVAVAKGPQRDAIATEETVGAEGNGDQNANAPAAAPSPADDLRGAAEVAPWKESRNLASDPKVQRCLRKAGAYESGGTLKRAFEARLAGIPAFFGVFETGEEPGDPVDRIVIWVAGKQACDVIGFAQAFIIHPSPSPFPEELEGITPPPGL